MTDFGSEADILLATQTIAVVNEVVGCPKPRCVLKANRFSISYATERLAHARVIANPEYRSIYIEDHM